MNKSFYETRTFRILNKLEEDLANDKLTRDEFEMLLGLLIEKEFTENIKWHIKSIMPRKNKRRGFGFVNYEWRHTHAR